MCNTFRIKDQISKKSRVSASSPTDNSFSAASTADDDDKDEVSQQ